ncbi:hypothetical protein D3C74_404860 [compost metagenome]
MRSAKTSVSPAFPRPYTTTYIPIEKTTMFHGAPFMTAFVSTAWLRRAIAQKIRATASASKDTGRWRNSLTRYPTSRIPITTQDKRNKRGSLMASAGALSLDGS